MHKSLHNYVRLSIALVLFVSCQCLQAQNFTPVDQPNLLLWLRADSAVVYNGSNLVSQWNDGAGPVNDSASQATSTLQPLYVANASPLINNKPALRFDGVDDVLSGSALAGVHDSSITIFIVTNNFGQTNSYPGFFMVNSNVNGWLMGRNTAAPVGAYLVKNNSDIYSAANVIPATASQYRIYGAVKQLNTFVKGYINGDSVSNGGSGAAGAFTNGPYRVGKFIFPAALSLGNTWKGDIAEVIVYRRALSLTERRQVENYLYNKYAPPVSLGPDISQAYSLCPVTLNASKRFVSYLWSNGSTADTLRVPAAGTYWVRTTDVFGRVSADTINVIFPAVKTNQPDTTVCLGSAISVAATPLGAYTYLWSNGATTSGTTISAAGQYYVRITDTNGCIAYSDTFRLSIDSFSTQVSLGPDTSFCGGNLIGLVSPSTGWQNLLFNWQPGNITTPTYTVNTTGQYRLQVTNSRGCIGRDTIQVTISGVAPTVAFTGDTLCLGETYAPVNTSASGDASPITGYEWNFGNGGTATLASPQYVYTATGSYTVALKVTVGSGCSNTQTRQVLVRAIPAASFTNAPISCIASAVQFNNTSVAAAGTSIAAWQWLLDGVATSSAQNPAYTYNTAGTYSPQLIAIDNNGCTDTAISTVQIVSSAPAPAAAQLSSPADNASLGSASVTFSWSSSATRHTLIVSADSLFGTFSSYATTGTSYTVGLGDGTYYWKVRAYGVCNDSTDSGKRRLKIFVPSSQPNLLLWLRADSGVVYNGSNLVSQWNDGAGPVNDSASQATTNLQPLYVAQASPLLNYMPAIRFDGLDDVLSGSALAGVHDSSITVFVVTNNFGQTNSFPGFFMVNSNVNGWLMGKNTASPAGAYLIKNNSDIYSAANTIPNSESPYRIYGAVKQLNTFVKGYINGDSVSNGGSGAAGAFTNGPYRVGKFIFPAALSLGNTWKGDIAEIIVYRRALPVAERKQVEEYLYNKYAPPVNLGPDIAQAYSLCPVTLNASKRFVNYLWSNGSTADTLRVTRGGTYWVRTTDVFGRVSADTVKVTMPIIRTNQPDTTVCLGNTINVAATPQGAYTYLWNNGAGTSATTLATAGQYYVKLTDINGCVAYSDTFRLSIDSFSTQVSLGPDTALCAGNALGLANPSSGWQNLSFIWQPGGITTATYNVVTSGQYSLQVTNSRGCIGRDTIQVSISGIAPTVSFTGDTLCLGQLYAPANTSAPGDASPITAYEWHFGDGGTSAVATPQYTYTATGSYTVLLKVTVATGCSNTQTRQVFIRATPAASFTNTPIGCTALPVQFNNTTVPAAGTTIAAWQWLFNGSSTASNQNPAYAYNAAGNYNPHLIAIDNFGCADTAIGAVQIVASAPAPVAAQLNLPANNASLSSSSVTFTWSSTAPRHALIISTDSLFGTFSSYATTGTSYTLALGDNTYYWKVRAYGICNDSIDSGRRRLKVFVPSNQPNLLLWLRADSGVVYNGSNLVSQWNDGAGAVNDSASQATSSLQPLYIAQASPLLNYMPAIRFDGVDDVLSGDAVAGIHDSSLTVFVVTNNFGQSNSYPGFFMVNSNVNGWLMGKNTANPIGAYLVKNNTDVYSATNTIPNTESPYRIYGAVKQLNTFVKGYINGDSVSNGGSSAAGAFTNGPYRVGKFIFPAALTLGNTWKGDIAEIIVYRRALPVAERKQVEEYLYNKYAPPVNLGPDIAQAYSLCPVTLNASKRFVQYLWSDGSTADTLQAKQAGIYWVQAIDVFGRVSADTINVSIPYAGMLFTDTVLCLGSSALLQPILTSAPYTFAWNSGQNTSAITISDAGRFVVTIADTNGCVVITDTVTVQIDSFNLVSLLPTDTITCTGNALAIDANGYSIAGVSWSTGASTQAILVGGAGVYTVTATNTNLCSVSDTVDITIKGIAPTVDFANSNVCFANASVFNDLASVPAPDQINSWQWAYGDGNQDAGQNVSHTYTAPGVYNVTYTVVTDSGCSASISKNTTVYGLPSAVITQLAPICAQNNSRISGVSIAPIGAAITAYQWQLGGNIVSTDTFLRYSFPTQGIVPVTLAVTTSQGCSDTLTRNIEIYAPFIADFEVANVCVGDSSYFFDVTPSLSVISRTWNFGDATSAFGTPNPVKKYIAAGNYSVTLTVTNAIGCRDTSVKIVTAASKPVANFTNLNGCEDDFYKPLDASSSVQEPINTWLWTIGGFNYSTQAPQRYFATPGAYPVKLIVGTATGCIDSITKTATIYPRPAVNFSYTPLYGDAPLNVNFTNQSTNDSTYLWEFGDGSISTQENPAYTYTQNGEYNVKLTVTSPNGCAASRTKPYSVIKTDLDYAINEAAVEVTPLPNGSSLAKVSVIGSNIGTRIIDHISYYITLGGVGVIAEDWEGTLLSGQGLLDTFSAQFVVPAGNGEYICVTAVSVNNGQQEVNTDNNSQCLGITEGIKVVGPLPNPAFNESRLSLILPKHGKVTLDISNMMGQYIVQGVELDLPKGRSDYDLPIGQMTAGEYFIRILYNDEKIVRKFIISR